MEKKDLLLLEPKYEIVFEGPVKNIMDAFLTISNPSETRTVQFKIKTTAPKTYFVRPNVGQLKPKEFIKVQISLQYFLFEQNKHKFLVQAAYGPDKGEFDPVFWKDLKLNTVWNVKLKSVVKMTDGEKVELTKKNISAPTEYVGDENEALMMEHVPEVVIEREDENNSADEYERDTKSKVVEPKDQIIATKPEKKWGLKFYFFIVSLFILMVALAGGYHYKNIKNLK